MVPLTVACEQGDIASDVLIYSVLEEHEMISTLIKTILILSLVVTAVAKDSRQLPKQSDQWARLYTQPLRPLS